jgi:hypothetical protein
VRGGGEESPSLIQNELRTLLLLADMRHCGISRIVSRPAYVCARESEAIGVSA